TAGPDLNELVNLFPATDDLAGWDIVPAERVPPPYRQLLVHDQHMTVTVEAHHGGLVDVEVLAEHREDGSYARNILLVAQKDRQVVQYGIMRINLTLCAAEVRAAILARKTPLGRILIEHNVLRRIEPTAYL